LLCELCGQGSLPFHVFEHFLKRLHARHARRGHPALLFYERPGLFGHPVLHRANGPPHTWSRVLPFPINVAHREPIRPTSSD
jgi:hypothetical protein